MNQKTWITRGFEAFRKGHFGNGGQNLYVSRKGILQRIHQTDITGSGYVNLMFCNSQSHEELVPLEIYTDPLGDPASKRMCYIGGASDAVAADLTGNGQEAMVWSCTWDGMTRANLSALYYSDENGPSEKYATYFPAPLSNAVAAGDFNGDGQCDIVFSSGGGLKFFYQNERSFGARIPVCVPCDGCKHMVAWQRKGERFADLLIRKDDGSVTILRGEPDGIHPGSKEEKLLPADPDYQKVEWSWNTYTQFVEEPTPRLQILNLHEKPYLAVFRAKELLLYPCDKRNLGKPLRIHCHGGLAAVAGDIFQRGCCDLLIAAREKHGHKEYSYIYPETNGEWSESARIPIATFHASDAALGDFSGKGGLDLAICQSHTCESYDSEVLIYPTSGLKTPMVPPPRSLVSHDAYRILTIPGKGKCPCLVIGQRRSGSLIGNAPNTIYPGSASGYQPQDRIELPGWGSVDGVCCDFNDDGLPDVAFANASELSPWLDPGSYVYYQGAKGFDLSPCTLKTIRAHGVVCGDLNHNGYLDLVFCGFDNPVIKVFYGSGEGFSNDSCREIRMEDPDGRVWRQPRFLSLADLNGDGYLDLIVSAIGDEESFVLWGGPEGFSFDRKQVFMVHHTCNSKVADLNNDGYPELIWGGHTQSIKGEPLDAFLYIYWGGPEGFSEDRRTMLPSNAVNSIAVADFNNDGLLDIFAASYENGRERDISSYIYWNSPDGFHPDKRLCLPTHAVSGNLAADLNGNGWIDLVVANHKVYGNHIAYSTIWYNGPGGFDVKNTADLPSSGPHGMGNVDPGNVLDRSFSEYYESAPHEIPAGCGIAGIRWKGKIPKHTSVTADFRTAETPDELKNVSWRGPIGKNSVFAMNQRVEKKAFTGKWMQYRLTLYAYNAMSTPRIEEVRVRFETIEEQE